MFDSCKGQAVMTPVEFMEYEIEKKSRMYRIRSTKGRMDIMEAARMSMMLDIKRLVNANSDDEKDLINDEDYQNMKMANMKQHKRADSDQSNNTSFVKNKEELYRVSEVLFCQVPPILPSWSASKILFKQTLIKIIGLF